MAGNYTTADGKDVYQCFVYRIGQGGLIDYWPPRPEGSSLSFKVIQDSTVLRIPTAAAPELMNHPECMLLVSSQLIESSAFHAKIKEIVTSYDAAERIRQFELTFPNLSCKLSPAMKASLLGISERTLYRIKQKK